MACHAPAISIADGEKMWVLASLAYLSVLFCAVLSAAASGLSAVLSMCQSAYVARTVVCYIPGHAFSI